MEEVPSLDFPFPVRWLRVGNVTLHLFESEEQAPGGHHFGLDVDDFEEICQRAGEMGARVEEGYFSKIYELPDGAAQLPAYTSKTRVIRGGIPRGDFT